MEANLTSTQIIESRWEVLPADLKDIFLSEEFEKGIEEIGAHHKLDETQTTNIKNEVLLVLFLFEPVSDLEGNIEKLGIPKEQAIAITKEIELISLYTVMDTLSGVGINDVPNTTSTQEKGIVPGADKNIKERLTLRPDGVPLGGGEVAGGPKPLTREEVLQALAPKRTMASDIASLQQKTSTPPVGYGAQANTTEVK
jgi:hypothetical protein